MSSTYYVCCIYLNNSHGSKHYARSCLIWVHIVCNKGNQSAPEDEKTADEYRQFWERSKINIKTRL